MESEDSYDELSTLTSEEIRILKELIVKHKINIINAKSNGGTTPLKITSYERSKHRKKKCVRCKKIVVRYRNAYKMLCESCEKDDELDCDNFP